MRNARAQLTSDQGCRTSPDKRSLCFDVLIIALCVVYLIVLYVFTGEAELGDPVEASPNVYGRRPP